MFVFGGVKDSKDILHFERHTMRKSQKNPPSNSSNQWLPADIKTMAGKKITYGSANCANGNHKKEVILLMEENPAPVDR